MDTREITETIGRRFHRPLAPSVVARPATASPIVFSHVSSDVPMPECTLTPPIEEAFAIHVHHKRITSPDIWIDGRHKVVPVLAENSIVIFDLRTAPVAQVHEPFEFSRFYMSRTTINDLAYAQGLGRVHDLRTPDFGHGDPVIQHLALAMLSRRKVFDTEVDSLFADGIALAFHAHVVRAYGGVARVPPRTSGLAPWQVRRVCDWMEANLAASMTLSEIAALLDLSPSHFSRAFRHSVGIPAHRWLLEKRVERARALLREPGRPLGEIASECGFADQSHFTRVFRRVVGQPPGRWRNRSG